ncbi:hypothetical protein FE392_08705 [Xenorhabdus sp. 12]|uniref:Uncharacterized protein n=1 Tax=Xenorhabdus santafensis TaxID=2582833 RepID=A0ABU4S9C3_9GAMM|nr:hypothetical protein [Xenorhabdus sp. 12]MDX7987408.1 hypothetical protein [Xenorhabdus sp. 12]
MIIDRERQVFYTWKKDKMYVSRYNQLDVVNISNILYLRVYGVNESNNLKSYFFAPRINNFIDPITNKSYFLTFISKYLLQGRESVSSVDFKRWLPLFLGRKREKPTDWEYQMATILTELDRLGPPDILESDL